MNKNFYSSLNQTATVADIMTLSADDFSAFMTKLKLDYKKANQIKSKKKAVTPYNFVMQKMRKMSKHLKAKCGIWGRQNYVNLQVLLDLVFEQHKEELTEMNFSIEKFKTEYAGEVALLLANNFFMRSCERYCGAIYSQEHSGVGGYMPQAVTMASFCVFKGTQYYKNAETGKRLAIDYKKVACSEGITAVVDSDVQAFKEFTNMWHYLGRSAVVKQLHDTSEEMLEQIAQPNEKILELLTNEEDENFSEDVGSDEIND